MEPPPEEVTKEVASSGMRFCVVALVLLFGSLLFWWLFYPTLAERQKHLPIVQDMETQWVHRK
jgi:hypothetical protein